MFADEDIKRGQLVYTASPLLDVDITQEEFDSLDEREKEEVRYWGFWNEEGKVWHIDFDVSKFINHSFEPAVTQEPKHANAYLIATRDIKAGEEFTQNYLEFESKEDLRRRGISVD